jgi:hypothetical protein
MISLKQLGSATLSGGHNLPIILSILDQGLLSGLSLGLTFALVKFGTSVSLGTFAIAMAIVLVSVGVQSALITTPAAVRIFGLKGKELSHALATLTTVDMLLAVGLVMD